MSSITRCSLGLTANTDCKTLQLIIFYFLISFESFFFVKTINWCISPINCLHKKNNDSKINKKTNWQDPMYFLWQPFKLFGWYHKMIIESHILILSSPCEAKEKKKKKSVLQLLESMTNMYIQNIIQILYSGRRT